MIIPVSQNENQEKPEQDAKKGFLKHHNGFVTVWVQVTLPEQIEAGSVAIYGVSGDKLTALGVCGNFPGDRIF